MKYKTHRRMEKFVRKQDKRLFHELAHLRSKHTQLNFLQYARFILILLWVAVHILRENPNYLKESGISDH